MIQNRSIKKEIHIINLVWGKSYLDLFLNFSLPNHISEKNLVFLSNQKDFRIIYKIYTTDIEKQIIESSEIYKKMIQHIEVEFIIVTLNDGFKYTLMNLCHDDALKKAFIKDAILIFLCADIICADNFFVSLFSYIKKDYRCVAIAGIRVSKEDFLKVFKSNHKELEISSKKLVKIALRNLHVASRALFVDSKKIPSGWCSHFYFKLNDSNLLLRGFHLHPIMIWPEKQIDLKSPVDATLIDDTIISKDKIKFIQDSDDLVLFELTDKNEESVYGDLIKRKMFHIGKWCHRYTRNFNKSYISNKFIFKASEIEESFRKIEIKSDKYISKIYKIYLFFKDARKLKIFFGEQINFSKRVFKKIVFNKLLKKNIFGQINFSKRVFKKIIFNRFSSAIKAFLLKSIKSTKLINFVKKFKANNNLYYQAATAPFIAKYFFWLFYPIYLILKLFKVCFVVNIAGGVGHIVLELDYFFRRLHFGETDKTKRYIWIRLPDVYNKTCISFYKSNFYLTSCSPMIYNLLLPIIMYYKDITLDCGLSRLKWQLDDNKKYYFNSLNQSYLYQISKEKNYENFFNYLKVRTNTNGFFPLQINARTNSEDLLNFLDTDKKIALIHLKEYVCNATASPTASDTYVDALKYLQKLNYRLVFVGREKLPSSFKDLSIINYAQSHLASFENDIKLFNLASLAIINGSGIAYLADCIDLPYLYINSWHIHYNPPSSKCIIVPALVMNKKTKKYLTISEQINLYESLKDYGAEIFPYEKYDAINASTDVILEALKELLSVNLKKESYLQNKISKKHLLIKKSMAKYCQYFLMKHENLL